MVRHIGSDGFSTAIPGICEDCFSSQKSDRCPAHYYCSHNLKLAVKREGGWETFSKVSVAELPQALAQAQRKE